MIIGCFLSAVREDDCDAIDLDESYCRRILRAAEDLPFVDKPSVNAAAVTVLSDQPVTSMPPSDAEEHVNAEVDDNDPLLADDASATLDAAAAGDAETATGGLLHLRKMKKTN